jgi:2-oxoglutarate dehydrogenase E1 component
VYAAKLAFAYRNKFNKDIFIDLIGFRRHGHNEADEPRATQPNMYQAISKLASTGESFAKSNSFEQQLVDYQKLYWDYLSTGVLSDDFTWLKKRDPNYSYKYENQWHGFLQPAGSKPITSIQQSKFDELAKAFLLPGDLKLQPQVNRVFDNRKLMSAGSKLVDWGFAELLAYASIISDGYNVRLSGQDARRGTFAHRHSTVFDQETGNEYVPLQQIARKYNRQYSVYDSLLSEVGVLAFEYGYATTEPNTLVIWEAQFGDFVNGAQVVIDQFISAGEQKWGRLSGLTLLLPHGYEGQGPEHSSARIERFLAACAQDNLRVCQPTTSAQIFHLLREQIKSDRRRPLIVFTPKSLLRSKHAGSSITSFTQGSFNSVIVKAASYCKKVLICSGKIYYQLVEALEKSNILDFVSLIRIEEFYPFPKEELVRYLSTIPELKERIYWVQDEPKNQGAWQYISSIFVELELGIVIKYIGRELQSSPAVGSLKLHNKQQSELIAEAISLT